MNRRPEHRAELRLVVNAGSVLESVQQRGLAHFVEHMAFNGTEDFHKQALVNYLERIGMRFGPDVNAYTSFMAPRRQHLGSGEHPLRVSHWARELLRANAPPLPHPASRRTMGDTPRPWTKTPPGI